MGLLDDAIREHLDLMRRLGGDPEEIKRMEREALGPVRREPTTADAQFGREPEPYEDEPYEGAHAIATSSYSDPFEESDYNDVEDSAFFDEQPTEMHQHQGEPEEEQHEHRRFGLFGRKSSKHTEPDPVDPDSDEVHDAHERTAQREQADYRDFERPDGPGTALEPEDEYPVADDFEDDDPFAREDQGQALAPQEQPPAPPSLSMDDAPPPPRRPRFNDQRREPPAEPEHVVDEAEPDDPGLHAADTAESGPRKHERWDDSTQLFEFDDDEPESESVVEEPAEDVLEGTPDFLQDTPDHDRLWFEQKPPRDFDFGN